MNILWAKYKVQSLFQSLNRSSDWNHFFNLQKIVQFLFLFLLSTGPISSILVNKYGSRPIMIAGGILASFGMIASSFCNSVLQLYICVGVIGGNITISFYLFLLMFSFSIHLWILYLIDWLVHSFLQVRMLRGLHNSFSNALQLQENNWLFPGSIYHNHWLSILYRFF